MASRMIAVTTMMAPMVPSSIVSTVMNDSIMMPNACMVPRVDGMAMPVSKMPALAMPVTMSAVPLQSAEQRHRDKANKTDQEQDFEDHRCLLRIVALHRCMV